MISNLRDAKGAEERRQKAKPPKGKRILKLFSWACSEELYDCHSEIRMEGYRHRDEFLCRPSLVGIFLLKAEPACPAETAAGPQQQRLQKGAYHEHFYRSRRSDHNPL